MVETTSESSRGSSVPVPQWWFDAVGRLVGRTGKAFKAVELAEKVKASKSRISKLLSNQITPLELVDDVSDALGIPRPVVVLATPELAQEVDLRIGDRNRAILAAAKAAAEAEVANIQASVERAIQTRQTDKARLKDHAARTGDRGDRGKRRRLG